MIALSPSTALLLRKYREKQEATRAMLGIPLKDDDLVFSHLEGKPLLPDTVSHAWTKIVERAGLKHFRLHDARHTHASLMLKTECASEDSPGKTRPCHYLNNARPL